jgi:predicted esterase
MSLQAVLRYPKRLGGAVCLSGWLMMQQSVSEWSTSANKDTPIFWGHGEGDGVVQFALQVRGEGGGRREEDEDLNIAKRGWRQGK